MWRKLYFKTNKLVYYNNNNNSGYILYLFYLYNITFFKLR